jgi:hypothetical protein
MRISENVQQAIDIQTQALKTQQDIAYAVLKKQADVQKDQGAAVLQLVQSAAETVGRGVDIRA